VSDPQVPPQLFGAPGVGVGVAVAHVHVESVIQLGFLQEPPEQIIDDGQSEFAVQVVPH